MKLWAISMRIPSAVLVLVAVLLSGVLYWEWDQGRELELRLSKYGSVQPVPVSTLAILPEFVLPDAESGFPELVSRSLFTPSRRSMGSSTKGGRSTMKKGQFVLVGVMVTPRQNSALLRDVQTNKTETIAQSGTIRGMTLSEVSASQVVLRQGAEFEELPLNVQMGPKGVMPPQAAHAIPATASPPTARPASAPASAASPPVPPKPVESAYPPKPPPSSPAVR